MDKPKNPDDTVEITTTRARLEQLDAVLKTETVTPIAFNAELSIAHEQAQAVADRYADAHPDAKPREIFDSYRGAMGRRVDIPHHDIHHRNFPLSEHQEDVVNPEMLEVTKPGALDVGTKRPAHAQLHEVYGGKSLDDTTGKYRDMAWGDEAGPARTQLMNWQAHQNTAARVTLSEVRERIDDYNKKRGD